MNPYLSFAKHFKNKKWAPYIYELAQKMQDGHICLDITKQIQNTTDNLEHLDILDENNESNIIGKKDDINHPFILDENLLYFQRYFKYEIGIVAFIQEHIKNNYENDSNIKFLNENKTLLPAIIENETIDFQSLAVLNSFIQHFSIITGGPGTGKTTTVTKLLKLCLQANPEAKIAIAAPTGKASSRLLDSLHAAANYEINPIKEGLLNTKGFTIHRLLGYKPNSIYFKHDKEHKLNFDIIVIDESSMIDIALFYKLLTAIGPHTKIVFVGDKNQLASVEAGSIFGDICNSISNVNSFSEAHISFLSKLFPTATTHLNKLGNNSKNLLSDHIVELQKSYRFNDQEGIGILSKAVIQNNENLLQQILENQSAQYFFELGEDRSYIDSFINHYQNYINTADTKQAINLLNAYKILCVTKEGALGIYQMNQYIQKYLAEKGWIQMDQPFYHNMPIIITQNNYDVSLYNGDIGLIRYNESNKLQAYFIDNQSGELIAHAPYLIGKFEIAYAMTIHKSQGSEFDNVLLLMSGIAEDNNLLSRELLYTGITRAKKHISIFSSETLIKKACATSVNRSSGLSKRL